MPITFKRTAALTLAAGLLTLPLSAQAEDAAAPKQQGPTLEQVFNAIDQNSDGSISAQEYAAFEQAQTNAEIALAHSYEELDANKDGVISMEELSKQKATPAG